MSKYSLEELAEYINMPFIPISWEKCYKNSLNNLSVTKWLNKNYIKNAIKFYGLIKERQYVKEIYKTIEVVKKDEKLIIIANLMHYILFEDKTNQIADVWKWNYNEKLFEVIGNNMLPLIVLLSGYQIHKMNIHYKKLDKLQKQFSIKGVHDSCLKDKKILGLCGIRFSQMVWGAYFINIKLVRIGCLEYEPFNPDDTFTKKINTLNEKYYIKNKINIHDKNIAFCKIHIPSKTEFTKEFILESLKLAENNLKSYFINMNNKKIIFFCESWLLSPDLDKFLKKNSNIIAFKNLFNICPENNNGKGYFKFLFNQKDIVENKDLLPEKTSLQKNVKSYLKQGKTLRDGYGVIKSNLIF